MSALRARRVREALAGMDETTRRIVELRYGFEGEPQPLETIGKQLGVSRERIRQLETQALARLEGELADLNAADEELASAA